MSKNPGPFRADAIASRSANQIGAALLSRPKTFSLMVTIVGLVVAALILMMVFVEYTSRATVGGIILPSAGLVKIYTPQAGTLSDIKVKDGSFVRKGQPLFTISNDKHANAKESTQASLSNLNGKKLRILTEQRGRAVEIASSQNKSLKETEAQLTAEITNLQKQVLLKRQRLSLTQQNASRYESLKQQGFISNEMLMDKTRDGLEQEELLTALERDEIDKQGLLRNNRAEQNLNAVRLDSQLLQLDREIADLEQESIENSNKYELTVSAPDDGRLVGFTARRHSDRPARFGEPDSARFPAASGAFCQQPGHGLHAPRCDSVAAAAGLSIPEVRDGDRHSSRYLRCPDLDGRSRPRICAHDRRQAIDGRRPVQGDCRTALPDHPGGGPARAAARRPAG